LVCVAVSVLLAATVPGSLDEDGIVEITSLAILSAATILTPLSLGWRGTLRHLYVPTILFLLAEREAPQGLDFVDTALLTADHWRQVAITPTTVAEAALLIAVIASAVLLPVNGGPALLRAWRLRAPWVGILLLGGLCAIGAQIVDKASGSAGLAIEEGLELAFALLLVICPTARGSSRIEDGEAHAGTGSHRTSRHDHMAGPRR
jgi:hypothetical protein